MPANYLYLQKLFSKSLSEPDTWQGFRRVRRLGLGLFALAALFTAEALSVRQFNLEQLCSRADRIMRVEVLDVTAGFIEAGGGKIPISTYRLRVKETLGGAQVGVIDIKLIGNDKPAIQNGNVRHLDPLSDLPRLEANKEYLLFTTPPSKIGLVTFVGLGQGCFRVYSENKNDYAVNELRNNGLGLTRPGPALYTDLAKRIRELRKP